ncbi:MAG: helix-turn-helix domain-containing protein [Oscillospiraceae bacterium]|nr:helix-turn-helix domain-containing protein [Oscillospiraceae bacterium]
MKKILFYENKNIISKQLKLARIKCGLSQTALAAKMQTMNVNIDQQMISKIENNTRIVTDYELACFCEILNVSEKELLHDFYESYGQ